MLRILRLISANLASFVLWLIPRPPCEECGRGLWRWRSYLLINDSQYQVMIRPFKWRWANVLARQGWKNSGYQKIYKRWMLKGPLEIREFTSSTPKGARRRSA